MTDIRIQVEALDGVGGSELVAALLAELESRYGEPDPHAPGPDDFSEPAGSFLVGYLDDQPVACGGIRRLEAGVAELKRMYVLPEFRRRGLSRVLLQRLEHEAVQRGYHTIRLETGILQPEARGLYATAGYQRIDNYPPYETDARSVCYERHL